MAKFARYKRLEPQVVNSNIMQVSTHFVECGVCGCHSFLCMCEFTMHTALLGAKESDLLACNCMFLLFVCAGVVGCTCVLSL